MRGRYSIGRREMVGTGGEPGGCGTEYRPRAIFICWDEDISMKAVTMPVKTFKEVILEENSWCFRRSLCGLLKIRCVKCSHSHLPGPEQTVLCDPRQGEGNHPPGSSAADQGDGSECGAPHVHSLPSRQHRQLHSEAGARGVGRHLRQQ